MYLIVIITNVLNQCMLIRRNCEGERREGICWNSPGKKKVHKSEVLLAGNNVLITESIAKTNTKILDSSKGTFLGFVLVEYNLSVRDPHEAWFLIFMRYYSNFCYCSFGYSVHRLSKGKLFLCPSLIS